MAYLTASLLVAVVLLELAPVNWKLQLTPKYADVLVMARLNEVNAAPLRERALDFARILESGDGTESDPWVLSESENRMVHIDYVVVEEPKARRAWEEAKPGGILVTSYTRFLAGEFLRWLRGAP